MVNRIVAKNRNVLVEVSKRTLSKFAIMLKHKDELNATELLELSDFMKALKLITPDGAKYIYLRFIKSSVIEQHDDYVIKNRKVKRIVQKYKCKAPSLTEVGKVMNKSYSELKPLEEKGYQELADLLLKFQLERMDLWEYVAFERTLYDLSYDKAKKRFDNLIDDDMAFSRYEIKYRKVYDDLDIYCYELILFIEEWRLKDERRKYIYQEGTHAIQRQCDGFRGRNRIFQS